MKDLLEATELEIASFLKKQGQPAFRTKQILDWLLRVRVQSISEMTNLSKELRSALEESFEIKPFTLVQKQESEDRQTDKYLWRLCDGKLVESVLIKSEDRRTVCVSSQVGCNARCAFCASGKLGLKRNLSKSEIVRQVHMIDRDLQAKSEHVTHVVYMGMGEPLDNFEEVIGSIRMLTDEKGMNLSQRRITVSTVGVVPGIDAFAKEGLKVNLVLSLHAPNQHVRKKIIPYARKYEFEDVLAAMDRFALMTKRDVTYEYILIDGINAEEEHARELAVILRRKQCTVNLIPYNPVDGLNLVRPPREKIERFREILEKGRINVTQRYTKGKDIAAACGQLALKEEQLFSLRENTKEDITR